MHLQIFGVFPSFDKVRPLRAPNAPAVHCRTRHWAEPIWGATQRRNMYGSPQSGSDWRCRRTVRQQVQHPAPCALDRRASRHGPRSGCVDPVRYRSFAGAGIPPAIHALAVFYPCRRADLCVRLLPIGQTASDL